MAQYVIAILLLLLGALLNETIRRKNRIEVYSPAIFEKRFQVYEQLWETLRAGRDAAEKIIEDTELTKEQRHEAVSGIIWEVVNLCEDRALYLNEEVTVHCCTVFMGVEDILPLESAGKKRDAANREAMISTFRQKYLEAVNIVKAESGLEQMDKLFRAVTKPTYSSDVIEYYRKLKRERGTL